MRRLGAALILGFGALGGACASFDDPTRILDLRVIAIRTEPPEQVVDVDLMALPSLDDILAQLQPIEIRAIVAEPFVTRAIPWTLSACVLDDDDGRCRAGATVLPIAIGLLDDPETTAYACRGVAFEQGGTICATLYPDAAFGTILREALEAAPARGLGGIDVGISLEVGSRHADPTHEVFAAKRIRFSPRIPAERTANRNPWLTTLVLEHDGGSEELVAAHCPTTALGAPAAVVRGGTRVLLLPIEPEEVREAYVLPTLDGGVQHLTEYTSYQWLATAGSFSYEDTGGPPDPFGNVKLLGTEWTAPAVTGDGALDVALWVVQRDGRFGVRPRAMCLRVVP